MESGSNKPVFLPPPEGYEFDNLITDISRKITTNELEELKKRFTGIKHVGTPEEMLHVLRRKGFIGRYNILYIQQVVRVLEREDLVEILEKYKAMFEEDKVLHFFEKWTEIAEGYKFVQFHILGHGLVDTKQLEELRTGVSRLLLCPLHDVIVKGIQETQSTLLTLMIPEMYVDFLTKQLKKHSQRIIKAFMHLGVDNIIAGEQEFLLQKEGELYKVKKSNSEQDQVKLEMTVSDAARAVEENQQTPRRRLSINNKCQQNQSLPSKISNQLCVVK